MVRLLLVDHPPAVRRTLRAYLALAPDLAVVGEADDVRLLTRGRANKEIARDLGTSETTVKTHVSSILGKLGVQSHTQAALHGARMGLVPLDEVGASAPEHDPRAGS
jgi:NarL family two-component system response regulator LiaR